MINSAQLLPSLLFPVLGGLLVGYIAGVFTCLGWNRCRRELATTERGQPVPTYTDDPATPHRRTPWRGSDHFSRLGWVLLILSIVGLVAGTVSIFQSHDNSAAVQAQAACLRDYTARTSAINAQRAAAGELDRQAIRQQRAVTREFNQVMIDAVTHPATAPAAQEKARADFLVKARDWDARLAEVDRLDHDADTQRQNNPLPPPPNC